MGGVAMEEERRLLFVAMSRAIDGLYLSTAKKRMLQGKMLSTKASRFLSELPEENMSIISGGVKGKRAVSKGRKGKVASVEDWMTAYQVTDEGEDQEVDVKTPQKELCKEFREKVKISNVESHEVTNVDTSIYARGGSIASSLEQHHQKHEALKKAASSS